MAALLTGCAHLGPRTILVDRFDYSTPIAGSWKQQTLLNILNLRYLDLPVFVDVSSVVTGYSLQVGVSVGGTASSHKAVQGSFATTAGQAIYTDRPTITDRPEVPARTAHPSRSEERFFLLQSGVRRTFFSE